MNCKYTKGFTLIELLVVISIISFLSSIILNSVNSARAKAKDAAIISELKQFEILLTLEYNENKSYLNLQPNTWYTLSNSICTGFGGNYQQKATDICLKIIADASSWYIAGNQKLFIGNSISQSSKYSMMAALNGSNSFYCVGSSGSSITSDTSWVSTGCFANP